MTPALTSAPLCLYLSALQLRLPGQAGCSRVQGESGATRSPSGRRRAGEWWSGYWRASASEVSSCGGKASGRGDALHKTKAV
ncbi:hypothetical protein RHECNPAF_1340056 [Rhizobium etli CNPAF512]|nr:hypothetical protein RHECNPAF_1340056 [Rhizobium etli CNPAF512]